MRAGVFPGARGARAQTAGDTISKPRLITNARKYSDKGLPVASGRSGSASLAARALLGKDGQTAVELTTGALDAAGLAPGRIVKAQLKPLGETGEALYADGVEIDRADGVWVNADGTVSAAFAHTFASEGVKQLSLMVERVTPGDYDAADNAAAGSVAIVSPAVRLSHSFSVSDGTTASRYVSDYAYNIHDGTTSSSNTSSYTYNNRSRSQNVRPPAAGTATTTSTASSPVTGCRTSTTTTSKNFVARARRTELHHMGRAGGTEFKSLCRPRALRRLFYLGG